MRLTNLLAPGDNARIQGDDPDITGIAQDSRKIRPGYLFAAIPGTEHDGRKYIDEAIANGAAAILFPLSRTAGEGGAQSFAAANDWGG